MLSVASRDTRSSTSASKQKDESIKRERKERHRREVRR